MARQARQLEHSPRNQLRLWTYFLDPLEASTGQQWVCSSKFNLLLRKLVSSTFPWTKIDIALSYLWVLHWISNVHKHITVIIRLWV
jgi:hypothetical protein